MMLNSSFENLKQITYDPEFLSVDEADRLFQLLLKQKKLTSMFSLAVPGGSEIKYDFGKLMFLDQDVFDSGRFTEAAWGPLAVFPPELMDVKRRIEKIANAAFGVCVAIYYPDGNSGVDFHSDKRAFGDTSLIPSMSLGEEREFCLRENRSGTIRTQILKHGSLMIMGENCQKEFEHSLPLNPIYRNPRINLTFRKFDR